MIIINIFISALIILIASFFTIKSRRKVGKKEVLDFSLYEHYGEMEKIAIEIQEKREPVDQVIILWWGLDGLRMNEDGTTQWIRRDQEEKRIERKALRADIDKQIAELEYEIKNYGFKDDDYWLKVRILTGFYKLKYDVTECCCEVGKQKG